VPRLYSSDPEPSSRCSLGAMAMHSYRYSYQPDIKKCFNSCKLRTFHIYNWPIIPTSLRDTPLPAGDLRGQGWFGGPVSGIQGVWHNFRIRKTSKFEPQDDPAPRVEGPAAPVEGPVPPHVPARAPQPPQLVHTRTGRVSRPPARRNL
jgi:hypothetical protein